MFSAMTLLLLIKLSLESVHRTTTELTRIEQFASRLSNVVGQSIPLVQPETKTVEGVSMGPFACI